MRKNILISGLTILGLIILIITYLNINGIKTNKLNDLINEKIKSVDSKLSLNINDVFIKLNLIDNSIKINIDNPKVYIENKFIDLSKIELSLDFINFIRGVNSIKKIQIISKENSIKNVTNFLNSYKFNISRFLIFNQIEKGNIKAIASIYTDQKNKNNFTYEVIGEVKNTNLNILNKNYISNINFNFNIKEEIFNFENINLNYENVEFKSKKINIKKSGDDFKVVGDLNNNLGLVKIKSFSKLLNLNIDFLEKKEISIQSENEFSFKINSNRSIKDLNLKSNLKFDEIFINKKYQELIYLRDGIIKTEYKKNYLSVDILSKYSFIGDDSINIEKDNNDLNLNIIKKSKENIVVKGSIKNNETYIDPKALFDLAKIKFDLLSDKKIKVETDSKFTFKIDKKQNVKDLLINSNLNFDKLYFNKKYQDLIFLEDGVVEANVTDKKFTIKIDSEYSFLNTKYNNKENKNSIKININKENDEEINIQSYIKNKKTKINSKEFTKYLNFDQKFLNDHEIIFGGNSEVNFNIDKEEKIKDLKIKSSLNFNNVKVNYSSNRIKKRIPNYNNQIFLNSDYLELDYSKDKTKIKAKGEYSFDDKFDNFEINLIKEKNKFNIESNIDLKNNILLIEEIDYKKEKDLISNIKIKLDYQKNYDFKFKDIIFSENKNKILISNLNLSKDLKIKDIDKLELNYLNKNNKQNDLKLYKNLNNYKLTGDHFDGKSLVKNLLNGDSKNSFLKVFNNLNSEIFVNLNKLHSGNQSYLKNIKGKLVIKKNKINSGKINAILNEKNQFSLNIKTNPNNEKSTNLYIERPSPFIKNYKFIKGFEEGSLAYDSIEKNGATKSKLKIYDFKVKEVPVLAKLLTLASLQGIADLLTGEGIRFDEFEMDYETENRTTTIKELYVIGPAISILMDGYIEKDKLTSLRGTLVPATTINKTIAKIPLLGNILVGKKVGEGVFGVSFKIKGPPKDLKTSVNPVKTLTPRFITRTLDKLKKN